VLPANSGFDAKRPWRLEILVNAPGPRTLRDLTPLHTARVARRPAIAAAASLANAPGRKRTGTRTTLISRTTFRRRSRLGGKAWQRAG